MKPDFESYGVYAVGMLGMLPDIVERMGCRTRLVTEITENVLDDSRVLFFANHNTPLSSEQYELIEDYVRAGGSLLVVGDHTFLYENRESLLNRLVQFSNIRFNFDSANFFVGGWLHGYRYLGTPTSDMVGREFNEVGSVIGCSLSVKPPAWAHEEVRAVAREQERTRGR